MSQQKMETPQNEGQSIPAYTSSVRIIGKYPFNHIEAIDPNQQYPKVRIEPLMGLYCPEMENKPECYRPMAKKIFVQGNFIAIIDWFDNLWFISDLFPGCWNMSLIYYKRAKNVFLSQNQCIISNRKNPILLNWGAKKVIDVSDFESIKTNQRYSKSSSYFFTAHSIPTNKDDKYCYSNIKKIDNSNKLYQLKTQITGCEQNGQCSKKSTQQTRFRNVSEKDKNKDKDKDKDREIYEYSIVAYPTHQVSLMTHKVVGISVGKVHCMCWDVQGMLYTWGNRSLALGYDDLPQEKITTKPRPVLKLNKFVTMAFAATHYSLAVTSEGHLYEWGIKKQPNQINEELIFEPKILKVGEKQSRVVTLKGRLDQIGCINSRHQLYIWGERSGKFFSQQVQKQHKLKNGHIYEPLLVPYLQNENIIDFGISEDYIAIIVSNSAAFLVNEQQKTYWSDVIKKVKYKLKLNLNIKTEAIQSINARGCQIQKQKQELRKTADSKPEIQNLQFFQSGTSNIEKCYQSRNMKRHYFKQMIDEDRFFVNLMRKSKSKAHFNDEDKDSVSSKHRHSGISRFVLSDRNSQTQQVFLSQAKKFSFRKTQSQNIVNPFQLLQRISLLKQMKNSPNQTQQKASILMKRTDPSTFLRTLNNKKFSQSCMKKSTMIQLRKTKIQSYQCRLQRVQQRKKSLQKTFNQQISKKVQQNSIQYRNLRHQQLLQSKLQQKNRMLVKQTLQSYLIKHYIVKMIMAPIQEGRRIKIEQFAKSLHFSRIQKNLKSIFVKARVRFRLGKLKKLNFIGFAILCHMFKQFVKRRRQIKRNNKRKYISQELFKYVIKQKIKFGLSKAQLNARKLQKFRQWLVMTKIQRLKCLRILWKNHLLSIVKVSNEADSITLLKAQQATTFEALYKQKLAANPMLKLQTFLNKSPIFELRSEYFQSIVFLFKKDNKAKSQKLLKSIKVSRRKRIKFSGQCQLASNSAGYTSFNDLLPYSLHYNMLIRPKSMQVNIPESMKKNQNWIKEQIKIFQKCLNQVIEAHQKNFLKARRKYDMEIAYFIREKYESLAEKRWKFLVEYNQINVTNYKKKKEKQLYRIFDLIGMQKTLNEDCLPEKYLMLEQAIKKKEAPVPPNPYITFTITQFRQTFKKYYQLISLKAKQARKAYI